MLRINEKGRVFPLPYFFDMLASKVQQFLEKLIEEDFSDVFIVGIEVKQGKRRVLSVRLDTDQGITMGTCTRISRKVNRWLEEEGSIEATTLFVEVSSPGVGYPLQLARQYPRNVGRILQVIDLEGNTVKGKLLTVTEGEIELDTRITSLKGKKKKAKKKKQKKNANEDTSSFIQVFNLDRIAEAKVMID